MRSEAGRVAARAALETDDTADDDSQRETYDGGNGVNIVKLV
jgi:hypothetical protein